MGIFRIPEILEKQCKITDFAAGWGKNPGGLGDS